MSADTKTFLKFAWILASVSCFILPLFVIPLDSWGGRTRGVSPDMIFGMLVLTFPAGVLYLLALAFVAAIFVPYELPVTSYVLLWFGFFVTGYLQWFHFLPHLLNKHNGLSRQGLTTLGLDKGEVPTARRKRHRRVRARRAKAAAAQLDDKRVLQFEEIRSTPLERVIGDR